MSYTSKYRGWCFTLNNYNQVDEDHIQSTIKQQARYIVYGREIGPDNGVPHLQGYIYFENQRQRKAVARLLPKAYLTPANGTAQESRDYCTKDGDYFEYGDIPMERSMAQRKGGAGNAARYAKAIEEAERGDFDATKRDDPQLFLLHGVRLESLYAPNTVPLDGELLHEWWVGPSGTGKSRLLWELYPNHFAKNINKWWDGYKRQDVVAIEEWSPKNDCTASSLKIWADRYPFKGEIKGGCIQKVRPTKIIVLSNYSPHQCFINSEDLEPILRRFTVIEFPRQLQNARDRAADFIVQPDQLDSFFDLEFDDESELPDLDLDILEDHT